MDSFEVYEIMHGVDKMYKKKPFLLLKMLDVPKMFLSEIESWKNQNIQKEIFYYTTHNSTLNLLP